MESTYHDLLSEEFAKRKSINGAYSLRSYARDLGISAPRLSQIMNKKQGLSIEAASSIVERLKLSQEQKLWFCSSVGALHARSSRERNEFRSKIQTYQKETKVFSEIELEYFKVISDWYHFAILELTYTKDFQSDPVWIAQRLGITEDEAITAIARMKGLKLLREENGTLKDVFQFLATSNDVPSLSIKNFHAQILKKATEALYEQDVNEREISSNIFSIRKEKLPEIKNRIRNFRRDLEKEASEIKDRDSVYCLSMHFFELTRSQE